MTEPILYTFAEAADVLNLPVTWLKRGVTASTIPHRRMGRHVRFSREDLDQLVEQTARQPVTRTVRTTRKTA